MPIVDALLLHIIGHRLYVSQQFVDDFACKCRFKHATSNDAERVDELAAIFVVAQQIEQQAHDFAVQITFTAHRRSILELQEIAEGVVVILIEIAKGKGIVEVEADETVAPVVLAPIAFHVVVGPVVVVEEHGGSHVIGKLVDVEQLAQLFVGSRLVDVLAQLIDALQDTVVTILHDAVLESIQLFIIVAEVGIGKVVVIRFAQVQHTSQLAIHILDDRHIRLHVEVDARALDDGFQGCIHETGVIRPHVVAAIAHEQRLVARIGLLREEGIIVAVLPVEHLAGFQLK